MNDPIKNLVVFLRNQSLFKKIFHTMEYCICSELSGCKTVLDIGCGPDSPIQKCKNIKYSVGVEPYLPYLKKSQQRKIHNKYLNKKIEDLNFPDKTFDAIILIDVIEHMDKKSGEALLNKISKWAKKKIIITTPNGYFSMGAVDGNSYQAHLSGWTVDDFAKFGYGCQGLTGAKFMYASENQVEEFAEGSFSFVNMRYKPKSLSFILNAFLQIFVYYLPRHAFELLAVKKIS